MPSRIRNLFFMVETSMTMMRRSPTSKHTEKATDAHYSCRSAPSQFYILASREPVGISPLFPSAHWQTTRVPDSELHQPRTHFSPSEAFGISRLFIDPSPPP